MSGHAQQTRLGRGITRITSEQLGIDIVVKGKKPVLYDNGKLGVENGGSVAEVYIFNPTSSNGLGQRLYDGDLRKGRVLNISSALDKVRSLAEHEEMRRANGCYGCR